MHRSGQFPVYPRCSFLSFHHLSKSGRSGRNEQLLRLRFRDTVGKGKAETLGEKLLEVWSLDKVRSHEFDDFEDLRSC